jgi:drug/metabolite transporter (DMT)-like permease
VTSDNLSSSHSAAAPVASLLLNTAVWGTSWWAFRQLDAQGLHSLWATTLVYVISTLVLLAGRPSSLRALAGYPALIWLGLAAGLTNASFNWGVLLGEVVRVVLLFYLMPVWAMLFARWLLGEAITPPKLARAFLALAGAALVLWRPGMGVPIPTGAGDWLGLAGGVAFAMVNVLLRRHADTPAQTRALAMSLGALVVPGLLAASLTLLDRIPGVPAPAPVWMLGVTALALALLAANLALQYGAARLPSSVTTIVMLSEVVFAAASAVLIGGESLSARTLAGGALILGASALAALSATRTAKPAVSA